MMDCDNSDNGNTHSGPTVVPNTTTKEDTPPAAMTSSPQLFDLEVYIGRYDSKSETRLQRLLFIASQASREAQECHDANNSSGSGGSGMSSESVLEGSSSSSSSSYELARLGYEMADRHMRERGNTRRYRQVFGAREEDGVEGIIGGGRMRTRTTMAGGQDGGEASPETVVMESETSATEGTAEDSDSNPVQPRTANSSSSTTFIEPRSLISYNSSWVTNTDQAAHHQLETLEARLNTAQAHLAKEAIRAAYVTLGDFYKARGELKDAMRSYLRSREYCTNQHQSGQMCLSVIELSVDMNHYHQVHSYVSKAEHTADLIRSEPLVAAKLRVASGLAYMADGRYTAAAEKFTTVSPDLTTQFNSVASAEDVALYGSLCALAALDRASLQRLVLDASCSFQQRLELLPWMRDALQRFARAEYGPCLQLLEQRRWEMKLDLHLCRHVDALLRAVRDRCVQQYFLPYSSVNLVRMAESFGMENVDEMESVVADLIARGDMKARIFNGGSSGSGQRVLTATTAKRRRDMMRKVEKVGDDFIREAESMVLRMACLEQDIIVQSGGSNSGGSGASRHWRGDGSGIRGRPRSYGGGMGMGRFQPQYYGDDDDEVGEEGDMESSEEDGDDFPLHEEGGGGGGAVMMDVSDTPPER